MPMNREPKSVAEPARRAPLRVLLIEDSPLIRRSLVEAIDSSGLLRVAAYADAADQAIALLGDETFDAVIIDLQLKQGSGVPVLAYLQREGLIDAMFAAVLTNHALPAYRARCEQYGVRHFYDKSFEFDRVLDALQEYALGRGDPRTAGR
ncbi:MULTISPECIES: response regulator [unclassified Paraburkholderia]|uniref:response regulator n=1 Tax=unclassified Paraburkholderia TaxID=2615204 RepID=UPI001965C13A|nr:MULTISPECIES: response regulator [unclassified Paraburkholderia]